MPDITMCKGTGCPLKGDCRRYLDTPSLWGQSYFAEPPFDPGPPATCSDFWQWKVRTKEGDKHGQRAAAAK